MPKLETTRDYRSEDRPKDRRFILPIFGRKYEHLDKYTIIWQPEGWYIRHIAHSGACDKAGRPHLKGNFHQDYIPGIKFAERDFLALWRKAPRLSNEKVQERLNQIGAMASPAEEQI